MILARGVEAAEELASALLGFSVHKAIDPLTPDGFLLIGERISAALSKAVAGGEAEVVTTAIAHLDVDWATLTPDGSRRALAAVNKAIGDVYAAKVLPKVSDVFEVEGPKLFKTTRSSVIARENIDISASLAQRDLAAEASIRKSQLNFIRDSAGKRAGDLATKAREIVARGNAQGLGTDVIAKDLEARFAAQIARPASYWRVVADSFVGRARTTSQIYSYEDAEIETFEVVAIIDQVTTDQCRFMDGQTFSVSTGRELLDQLTDLEDPEDVKYANPWVRKGADESGGQRLFVPHADGSTTTIAKIDRSGVGASDDRGVFSGGKSSGDLSKLGIVFPPYHGRCRTIIVAGAESSDVSKRVLVFGADLVPRK